MRPPTVTLSPISKLIQVNTTTTFTAAANDGYPTPTTAAGK